MVPEPSLAGQAACEIDRRRAAHLSRDELHELADRLICDWYQHRSIIEKAHRWICRLEIEAALAAAPPSKPEPAPEHYRWAQELLSPRAS